MEFSYKHFAQHRQTELMCNLMARVMIFCVLSELFARLRGSKTSGLPFLEHFGRIVKLHQKNGTIII